MPYDTFRNTVMSSIKRRFVIFLLLSCFFVQSFYCLSSKSATFDEVQYFGIGKYLLTHQSWDVMGAILHPPLSYYLNSLPLFSVQEDIRLWEYEGAVRDLTFLGAVDVYRGQALLSSPWNENDRLLIASRSMTLLLSLLLGFYIYKFSSALYGEINGLLPLVLFSFCPNMLAYSGLIIPDISLTTFTFIALYYLWLSIKDNSRRNHLLAGFFFGLALLSKFTALLLFPVFIVVCLMVSVQKKCNMFSAIVVIFATALFTLLAGYGFDITPYFMGLQYQLDHAVSGHNAFLIGEYSTQGWWYYYIVVFLLKTPIPVIILFIIALVLYVTKPLRGRIDGLFLLTPIILFFLLFSIKHQSIGIRYILPIYPFVFVFIGRLLVYDKKIRYFSYGLVIVHVSVSLFSAPHYLAYFNEFAGRAENGYKYLVDSNLDWGQDLKGLKKYMVINNVKRVSLSYFGADSPQRYGINYDWLPSHHLYNPEPGKELQPLPKEQLIAISATNLQGIYLDDINTFQWLKQYKPVAKIGYSIFLYDLSRSSGSP